MLKLNKTFDTDLRDNCINFFFFKRFQNKTKIFAIANIIFRLL